MTELKDQPRLTRRNGIYYYRRRVPAELLTHLGRKEVVFSLKTSDRRKATELARLEDIKYDQQWAQILAARDPIEATGLSLVEIDRYALIYKASILSDDEDARREAALDGPLSWMYDHMDPAPVADELEELEGALSMPRALLQNTTAEDRFLASQGLRVGRDNPSLVPLMEALKAARQEALQGLIARYNGQRVPTPSTPSDAARPVAASNSFTLDDILADWKRQRSPRPRTLMDAETAVTRLKAAAPDITAGQLTKAHIVAYRDAETAKGLRAATVKKSLGLLQTVFQIAVDDDKLPLNPVKGVRPPAEKQGPKARIPFAIDDLCSLFSSPVFTAAARPEGGKGEAAYWLPLIALFTGARQSEIAQLQTTDIREEMPGIWCINFTDDSAPEQTLKTASSRRRVPVHPELHKCGFLDYWRARVDAGGGPLFPLLKRTRQGSIAAAWSQWFGRYLRGNAGIADKRKVFHSFRHGFKDAMRSVGVEKAVNDALTGHEPGDVGSTYGAEDYPLDPLVDAINKLHYRGLDLSHLFRSTS